METPEARDASMHDSIIDNNGLRQNLELMEKRLQSLAEYQQVLSFATLNSKIDNLQQAINQQMNTTGNLHHSYYPHCPPLRRIASFRGFKVFYNRRYFLNFRRYLKN
jgi:hypothetical protein